VAERIVTLPRTPYGERDRLPALAHEEPRRDITHRT
jgi:hypothetical protein